MCLAIVQPSEPSLLMFTRPLLSPLFRNGIDGLCTELRCGNTIFGKAKVAPVADHVLQSIT